MSFRPLLAAFAGLAFVVILPARARAEEPVLAPAITTTTPAADAPARDSATEELPPPGARTNLLLSGAATTLVAYGLGAGSSFLLTEDDLVGVKQMRIPVAGPWLALAKTSCPPGTGSCSKVPLVLGAIFEVFDGVAQLGGLGLIGEGLFLKTSSGQAPRKAQAQSAPTFRALPVNFENGGVGLGVFGTF